MKRASIIADLRHMRCDNCKVAFHDDLATVCPTCGAEFDSITSNHAGLAAKLERRREAAGVHPSHVRLPDQDADANEMVGS